MAQWCRWRHNLTQTQPQPEQSPSDKTTEELHLGTRLGDLGKNSATWLCVVGGIAGCWLLAARGWRLGQSCFPMARCPLDCPWLSRFQPANSSSFGSPSNGRGIQSSPRVIYLHSYSPSAQVIRTSCMVAVILGANLTRSSSITMITTSPLHGLQTKKARRME